MMMRTEGKKEQGKLEVEPIEREEGERLFGTTEALKSSGIEREIDRAKMRRDGRDGEREGMTAWPRAPDTGCHLEINQQPGPEPTNQKLLLHLLNSCPFPSEFHNLEISVLSTLYLCLSLSFII